ncbi:MAG: dephospho-CoA kinase [Bacteroidota bacterium]|nr:dephospho-CoA kinase [Bacteroidota bacterium]
MMPLKIGLTGGIGSGKTTVSKIFQLLGVPVYDADASTKNLYETNFELRQALMHHFGEDIYTDTDLNRQMLSRIVFSDPSKLQLLNNLVHPLTIKDAEKWMNKQETAYVIKEAALLYESGSVRELDFVIGVRAPKHLRIQRALERDKVTREEVINRMRSQIDEDIKMRLCDFIITNDEQQLVIPQVLELHIKLSELATKPLHLKWRSGLKNAKQ